MLNAPSHSPKENRKARGASTTYRVKPWPCRFSDSAQVEATDISAVITYGRTGGSEIKVGVPPTGGKDPPTGAPTDPGTVPTPGTTPKGHAIGSNHRQRHPQQHPGSEVDAMGSQRV